MAKRRSYKQDEKILTRLLLADVAVFVLYLLFAGLGITAMKVITVIIAIIISGLCLAFLYMTGEIKKLRSRWLVMGFGAIVLLMLVSLLLRYPAPSTKAPSADAGSTTSTSASADSTDASDASDAADTTDGTASVG